MNEDSDDSSSSDYIVEEYLRPDKVRKALVNDDSADLLGNFDDDKRRKLCDPSIYSSEQDPNPTENEERELNVNSDGSGSQDSDDGGNSQEEEDPIDLEINTKLSKDQLADLMKGASKKNRYVLYVTNLNFETTKEDLETFFLQAGEVKGVRVPHRRRGGSAFIEMTTIDGFQKAFEFHNAELHSRKIKIQISEGGKKKSANKKNILKQKNRKLAEMRNEKKSFSKSGKNYDKNLKKEKAKEMLLRKRRRKNPS